MVRFMLFLMQDKKLHVYYVLLDENPTSPAWDFLFFYEWGCYMFIVCRLPLDIDQFFCLSNLLSAADFSGHGLTSPQTKVLLNIT